MWRNMVNPKLLMRWVDDFNDVDPGTVDNHPLTLIAHQIIKRFLRKKVTHNWIYQVGDFREIAYKPYPLCPAVMKMGVSGRTFKQHPNSVSMESYAQYFLDKVDPAWLKRNRYELV